MDEFLYLIKNGTIVISLPWEWRWFDGGLHRKWEQRAPRRGDHIRVQFGKVFTAHHHGVYISDDEVIHFHRLSAPKGLFGVNNNVISTSVEQFVSVGSGWPLEVRRYSPQEKQHLYPPNEIVNRAKNRLGEDGYKICVNNCEHFANWCTLGEHHSTQVDGELVLASETSVGGTLVAGTLGGVMLSGGFLALKGYKELRESFEAARIAREELKRIEQVCENEIKICRQIVASIEADKRKLAEVIVSCNDTFRDMDRALENSDLDSFIAGLSNISRMLGKTPRHETLDDIHRDFSMGKLRLHGTYL